MENDVFISYSSKDRPFAQQVARALEQNGLSVWIDRDDIRAGIKWSSAIQQGLDASAVIVVIITRESMASKNVEDEWQYFLDKRKPIVPILHTRTDNIHFQLMRIQYVDFVNNSFDDAINLLLYELRQHNVGGPVSDPPKILPVPPMPASAAKTRVPNQRRNITVALAGAVVTIALVIIGFVIRNNSNLIDIPASTALTEQASSVTASPNFTAVPTQAVGETAEPSIASTSTPSTAVMVDVPYVSQFANDAPFSNDDAPASLLMILKWYTKTFPTSKTASRVMGLTVKDVSIAAGMTSESKFVLFSGLIIAANSYALPNQFCRGINRERIFKELDSGRPVLILVNFATLRPDATYVGGHAVVVAGYDAQNVTIYDPHNRDDFPESQRSFQLPMIFSTA